MLAGMPHGEDGERKDRADEREKVTSGMRDCNRYFDSSGRLGYILYETYND